MAWRRPGRDGISVMGNAWNAKTPEPGRSRGRWRKRFRFLDAAYPRTRGAKAKGEEAAGKDHHSLDTLTESTLIRKGFRLPDSRAPRPGRRPRSRPASRPERTPPRCRRAGLRGAGTRLRTGRPGARRPAGYAGTCGISATGLDQGHACRPLRAEWPRR